MAHYAKQLSFLLLIVLSSSICIEARENKFFSWVTHNIRTTTKNKVEESELSPVAAPILAPAPAPITTEENGYGLYGHDSTTEFPFSPSETTTTTTTTTTIPGDENEIPNEELSNIGSYKESNTEQLYNNYNNNNYNNNNNGYYRDNYNNNGYTKGYNGNYGKENQKQGMSDTRFVENGKYYYNVNSENYYRNGYEPVKENGVNGGYYGNSDRSNEFDSMEEYERQEGYPQTQPEYVP